MCILPQCTVPGLPLWPNRFVFSLKEREKETREGGAEREKKGNKSVHIGSAPLHTDLSDAFFPSALGHDLKIGLKKTLTLSFLIFCLEYEYSETTIFTEGSQIACCLLYGFGLRS